MLQFQYHCLECTFLQDVPGLLTLANIDAGRYDLKNKQEFFGRLFDDGDFFVFDRGSFRIS